MRTCNIQTYLKLPSTIYENTSSTTKATGENTHYSRGRIIEIIHTEFK